MKALYRDQFGRPEASRPIRLTTAALIGLITGSVCPPPARSAHPPLDSIRLRDAAELLPKAWKAAQS
jgi:hypothetical protein